MISRKEKRGGIWPSAIPDIWVGAESIQLLLLILIAIEFKRIVINMT